MALRIVEEASLTDVGRQRHTNEDAYYAGPRVYAVADGMGGAQAGEVAAQLAVEEFGELRDPGASPEEELAQVARAANRKIWELAQRDSTRAGMGTTLTAVMVGDHEIAVGHVGDSRLYRLREGRLERLTHDHSLVEELVRQRKLTPEQAESHPQRSVITRALGPESEVDVETFSSPARGDDVYLLCSDGLTTMVPDEEVEEILREAGSLDIAARQLVDAANARGGRDNITVLLVRLGEDRDRAAAEQGTAEHPAAVLHSAPPPGVTAPPREFLEQGTASPQQREAPRAPSPGRRPRAVGRRPRRLLAVAAGLLVLVGLGIGAYEGGRQIYFIGTNDQGFVTLYRGVPYNLPLGIHLYGQQYVSGVPARSIAPERRRHVLDHRLRSRSDAVDLVRQLELTEAR